MICLFKNFFTDLITTSTRKIYNAEKKCTTKSKLICAQRPSSVQDVDSNTCHDFRNASLRNVSEMCDVGSLIPTERIFVNNIFHNSIVNPVCDQATKIYVSS